MNTSNKKWQDEERIQDRIVGLIKSDKRILAVIVVIIVSIIGLLK